MKILYIVLIAISTLFLLVIYFTNIMWLWNQVIFVWSQNNSVSFWTWLLLLILISFILWFSVFWLMTKLVNKKPKDFDEFDL